MKKASITIAMLFAVNVYAQKIDASKVPAEVKKAFAANFRGVGNPKWEMEGSNYEAGFRQNNKSMSALFDAQGKLVETETGIKTNELPAAVKEYVSKNYAGQSIAEAAIIKKPSGEINYEAEVNGEDLLFDKQSKFIKAVKD